MDSQGVSRDEAMASGLVPVTNAIAAIPEFTDVDCAFAVPSEDYKGIADAIERLAMDPDLFAKMSRAAAHRVRQQSNLQRTIQQEIKLIRGQEDATQDVGKNSAERSFKLAIYGDVNLNIMDGSAVWAASACEVMAGLPNVATTLFLKAPIERTQVLQSLLTPDGKRVRLIEPTGNNRKGLSVDDAVTNIVMRDSLEPFDAIILRGKDLCIRAIASPLAGKIWAYLTDIPQQRQEMTHAVQAQLESIFDGCQYVLCQTPQMRDFIQTEFPAYREKLRILLPMIPQSGPESAHERQFQVGATLQIAYAGKFAPRWGIREMFETVDDLRKNGAKLHLQLFGDKVHNPPDDPSFQLEVKSRLRNDDSTTWHGSVDRATLYKALKHVDVCWAYRDPQFEQSTRELSTKALEYASLGVPTILTRSHIFEDVFGPDYPLFASSREEAQNLLTRLLTDPTLHTVASKMLVRSISPYKFQRVRDDLIHQALF